MSDTQYPLDSADPARMPRPGLGIPTASRSAVAGTLLMLVVSAGPAFAQSDLPASCDTIAHIVATLPEHDWASSVVAMKRQRIVGLSVSDPITATILCPHAPQIICMEISNPEKAVGDVVSLTGSIARADARYVLLDPCFSMKPEK